MQQQRRNMWDVMLELLQLLDNGGLTIKCLQCCGVLRMAMRGTS